MSSYLTQAEKTIFAVAGLAIVVFVGFFTLVNKSSSSDKFSFDTNTGIDYKMARPEQAYSEYTLEGRELDEVYEALPEATKKALLTHKKVIAAKAKEDAKKKDDAKKKQVQTQKAQTVAQNANQPAVQNKLAKDSQKQNPTETFKTTSSELRPQSYSFVKEATATPVATDDQKKKESKKSFSDWRNEIYANPTSEVLALFIGAYRKGDISSVELQAMAQDLLDQKDVKLKGLGLAVLRSVPSLVSLSTLVHEEAELPESYQTYVEQSYITYFYPQNLSYFISALQSRDEVLKAKVLNLLQTHLTRLSQGEAAVFTDARNIRSGDVSVLTMNSFVALIPALNAISTNGEQSEMASVAHQVSTLIQSHNNVAQN